MAKKADTDFRAIAADIKKGNFAPVYLLMGEEAYYLDVLCSMLEQAVVEEDARDFNASVFYGAETDIETVATTAREFPMMSDRRLVVLKEMQAMRDAKSQLEKLAGYFANPTPTTVLVIVLKGEGPAVTNKALKTAAKSGAVIFRSPKLRDYQLDGPISDYCQSKRIGIDDKARDMLKEYVGADLAKLFSEIDKLLVAGGGNVTRISPALIERNIGISKEYNNFELTNAIAVRDYAKAIRIVKYFSQNTKANPTVMTTAALFNFFSRLTVANLTRDRSDSSLMAALQLKNAYALRELRTALASYNTGQCLAAISAIRDFDCQSKGIGSMANEYQLLKSLIFKLMTI